ncbi:hypothetical protein D4764_05G0008870 [Takifugu flavidus]|uniref:C2H2-type domain-containing protein n=1 Tax=Takifugu flavidus TaxID=433684 RepID=A0A5C6N4X5_9TELE|nr:hypothetical protein D4764_05G0008870 [Takifugu flavidus]
MLSTCQCVWGVKIPQWPEVRIQESKGRPRGEDEIVRCERCDRSFTQATQLSRHQRLPNECKPVNESESIEVD